MAASSALARAAKRSKAAIIAVRIVKDRLAALGIEARLPIKRQGATHRGLSTAESVAYVDAVYGDYRAYGKLGAAELDGASVLELGPGDSFGVALRLLGAGAARVTTLDRFVTWRDRDQQDAIHRALLDTMPSAERERAAQAFAPGTELGVDPARIRVIQGVPAEDAVREFHGERFELIVSRAVLEHVTNPAAVFAAMDELLVPGGLLVHKVDLSDHGLFTAGGHDPLTFLTVREPTYRWMGEHSGLPNRHLADFYRAELDRRGYEATFLVTHAIGADAEIVPHLPELPPALLAAATPEIETIRPRLLPLFRDLSAADLATAGIFVTARKPGAKIR
jgi:SAM-dependent methyltransferase